MFRTYLKGYVKIFNDLDFHQLVNVNQTELIGPKELSDKVIIELNDQLFAEKKVKHIYK